MIVNIVFLLLFVGEIRRELSPPVELLVVALLLVFLLDGHLLASPDVLKTTLMKTAHLLLLAGAVLSFGLLLVANNDGKKGVIIRYLLLCYISIHFLEGDNVLLTLLVHIVLFVLLLRRTSWLEELTKSECWAYWFAVILVLRGLWGFDPFEGVSVADVSSLPLWFALPRLLFMMVRIYIFVLAVKIPVVLVYNFASLSRKLKISSLFQSTIPQFIQLALLLVIFYLFVAGLQAEKVRSALKRTIDQVAAGEAIGVSWLVLADAGGSTLFFHGLESIDLPADLPGRGVLALQKRRGHSGAGDDSHLVIFSATDSTTVFVKLDSAFLNLVAKNTSLLAGSFLSVDIYSPPEWEAYSYDYLGGRLASSRYDFSIFPLGLSVSHSQSLLHAPLADLEAPDSLLASLFDRNMRGRRSLIAGRVVAPVFNSSSEFLVIDVLLTPGINILTPTLFGYVGLLILIYFLVNMAVTRRMVKFGTEINQMIVQKFDQLKRGIREISSGNFDYKVAIEGEDEFVELGEHFNEMGVKLKQAISEAREKERLEHELTLARQVQLRLLPTKMPDVPGFEIAAMLSTAHEVGGDFYEVLPLDRERFLIAVGDVSGKGTSAAFYMAQCMSLLRYSLQFTQDPKEIAVRMNEYFSSTTVDKQIFVTATLGVLDAKSATVRLVRAGHTPPILLPGDASMEVYELQPAGTGIGFQVHSGAFADLLTVKKIKLQRGDTLVLLTDGVEEAARPVEGDVGSQKERVEFFGAERVKSILAQSRGQSAQATLSALQGEIESFYGGYEQQDDYTVVVVRRLP